MRRLIIDTDTASDDAVALMMALRHPDVQVDAITVVAGNVQLEQASRNTRFVAELCNADVPVYEGCDRPWLYSLEIADWFHGKDGMGDQGYAPPRRAAEGTHAVSELVRRLSAPQSRGDIELVTLGPLTNIASALALAPDLAHNIRHCWIMGGAANTVGNVTPAAEYNIWVDPHAAQRVFQSGMPITMIGWEHSRYPATLNVDEMAAIRSIGTERAIIAMDCNSTALHAATTIQQAPGLALADPVAMAVALDEQVATSLVECHVEIAVEAGATRGMTIVDRLGVTGRPANARVCTAIDSDRWKRLLHRALGGAG